MDLFEILLKDLPSDPVKRIVAVDLLQARINTVLGRDLAECYYQARALNRLSEAIDAGPWSKTQVVATTRALNEERGRTIRWRDGYR